MKLNENKKIFIVWGRELELSRNLANALGAEIKQVYYRKIGPYNIPAFFRYVFQAAETLLVLFHEKPAVVIVQNPPVFAPLTVMLYCKISGARFAIDSHTAAFLDKKWVNFYGLFKFAAKGASLNSCHNFKNLEILKSWNIEPAMVMQFYDPHYDLAELAQPMKNENIEQAVKTSLLPVMMVNRFANDDDYKTVIKTAEMMPEIKFFITGDYSKAGVQKEKMPANVILTGYLEHQEFLKLMNRCQVILAFTLRPDTVLWSVREAMALNKPFVTTDSEALKHYFNQVGLFTKSDAKELKEKILEAKNRETEIKQNIKIFLEKDELRWQNEIEQYKNFINN